MNTFRLRLFRSTRGDDAQTLACRYKRAYASAAKAKRAAASMKSRYGRQYAYQCPVCECWHLTSKEQ